MATPRRNQKSSAHLAFADQSRMQPKGRLMADLSCDVAIIGAGTAGLAAERTARKAGAKTLLIDDRFAGTTCASVGCMPSKLLIAAADAAHGIRRASTFGILATKLNVDGCAVMRRLRKERDGFVAATLKSIGKIPEGICVRQRAQFADRTRSRSTMGARSPPRRS